VGFEERKGASNYGMALFLGEKVKRADSSNVFREVKQKLLPVAQLRVLVSPFLDFAQVFLRVGRVISCDGWLIAALGCEVAEFRPQISG
jgi:hypothetical protein